MKYLFLYFQMAVLLITVCLFRDMLLFIQEMLLVDMLECTDGFT